jgi:predicted nucleic acid-binding protein
LGPFLDSNVPLYLLSKDEAKAGVAERVLRGRGIVSVQVLNEFVSVARRKHGLSWDAVDQGLSTIRHFCVVAPLTVAVHERAVVLARRLRYSIYDATIIASALDAGATILYSEDMHHGHKVETLVIVNPFQGL